jgi:hypothetical protein
MKTLNESTEQTLWLLAYIPFFLGMWWLYEFATATWKDGQDWVLFGAKIGLVVAGLVAFVISGALSDSKMSRIRLFHISYMLCYLFFVALFI